MSFDAYECKICYENYNTEIQNRIPMILPCDYKFNAFLF